MTHPVSRLLVNYRIKWIFLPQQLRLHFLRGRTLEEYFKCKPLFRCQEVLQKIWNKSCNDSAMYVIERCLWLCALIQHFISKCISIYNSIIKTVLFGYLDFLKIFSFIGSLPNLNSLTLELLSNPRPQGQCIEIGILKK